MLLELDRTLVEADVDVPEVDADAELDVDADAEPATVLVPAFDVLDPALAPEPEALESPEDPLGFDPALALETNPEEAAPPDPCVEPLAAGQPPAPEPLDPHDVARHPTIEANAEKPMLERTCMDVK